VSQILLTVEGAAKNFGGVKALVSASLTLYSGEIHALLGENGAGKSTLLKAFAGVHSLDSGEIKLNGAEFRQGSTRDARDQGIAVIYQEPNLFPDLTLAENVFAGRQPVKSRSINWKLMNDEARQLFEQLGVSLNPRTRARGLSIADQQIVEIAKAISTKANVIVMDEPTAALSSKEVSRLFAVARTLRDQGCAVVFVSHRLDEVFDLCDRITIMRDGSTVNTSLVKEISEPDVIRAMVGRDVSELFPKLETKIGEVVLEVKNLAREGQFENISFNVRKGEIVALAGLVGSGRSEIARAIFGVDAHNLGTVTMNGQTLENHSPAHAMEAGIALVPEDRRLQGLFMPTSIARNAAITSLSRIRKSFLISSNSEIEIAKKWTEVLQTKFAEIHDPIERLSGGNQQKVVLAKWLATNPKLLIVDEPTRGIDVGTKSEVHRLLSQKAKDGMAVLMISSELPEVLGMADRILVMREGHIVKEFNREEATSENIIAAATGSAVKA
jgi:rhamnose transport system ATP-binding protein